MRLAKLFCPFCNRMFALPDQDRTVYLDARHESSCGCGTIFCLTSADDIAETRAEILEAAKDVEIKTLPSVDALSDHKGSKSLARVDALFWKPPQDQRHTIDAD